MTVEETERAVAIFRAGEIMGVASGINIKALEQFLENPEPDFRYTPYCKAILELAKLVQGVTTTTKENKTE